MYHARHTSSKVRPVVLPTRQCSMVMFSDLEALLSLCRWMVHCSLSCRIPSIKCCGAQYTQSQLVHKQQAHSNTRCSLTAVYPDRCKLRCVKVMCCTCRQCGGTMCSRKETSGTAGVWRSTTGKPWATGCQARQLIVRQFVGTYAWCCVWCIQA